MADKPYNKELIGKILSVGGEHMVFYYDTDKVIKFPIGPRYLISPGRHCENLKRYDRIINNYFSEFLIEKDIVFFKRRGIMPSYVIVERYVKGRHLRYDDLYSDRIREKFFYLLNRNREMVKNEGMSLDILGIWNLSGFTRVREFANIILEDKTENIYLLDHGIWSIKKGEYNFFVDLFVRWAYRRQNNILNNLLKSVQ